MASSKLQEIKTRKMHPIIQNRRYYQLSSLEECPEHILFT